MYSLAFGPGSKSEEVGILTRIWQKVFNLTNVSGRDTCLIKTSPMFALVKIGSGAAIRASPTRLLGFYGLKVRFLRLVVAGLSTARDLCARYGRFYAVVKWHRDFIHLEFQGYGLHSHSCLVSVMCEVLLFFSSIAILLISQGQDRSEDRRSSSSEELMVSPLSVIRHLRKILENLWL